MIFVAGELPIYNDIYLVKKKHQSKIYNDTYFTKLNLRTNFTNASQSFISAARQLRNSFTSAVNYEIRKDECHCEFHCIFTNYLESLRINYQLPWITISLYFYQFVSLRNSPGQMSLYFYQLPWCLICIYNRCLLLFSINFKTPS